MVGTPTVPASTEAGRARFDAVVHELSGELDIVQTSMFGMASLTVRDGTPFAGLYGDDMVFKLEAQAYAAALALDGAHHFEPTPGRPMKAWVLVPPTHETQWAELARKAEASGRR